MVIRNSTRKVRTILGVSTDKSITLTKVAEAAGAALTTLRERILPDKCFSDYEDEGITRPEMSAVMIPPI